MGEEKRSRINTLYCRKNRHGIASAEASLAGLLDIPVASGSQQDWGPEREGEAGAGKQHKLVKDQRSQQ